MTILSRKSRRWLGVMLSVLLIVLLGHLPLPAVAASPRHYNELTFPPLPEVKLPSYERYQLANGLTVYLMEDHQLPLVKGYTLIRAGTRWDAPEQVGLAQLTGTVLRLGGTQQHSPDEINEALEQRAANIEANVSEVAASVNFDALSEDLAPVLSLFGEILCYPAFAAEQLALAKVQKQGEIARRNDDPGDIADREFQKLIYGSTSPYARTVEYETLANIDRQDLVTFHQRYFHPDRMILGIVGDFEPQELKALIEKTLGDWPKSNSRAIAEVPPAAQANPQGLFLVERPQLTQSNILLGHLGGQFNAPDYPALSVLNAVLNGFGGRLFNEVRSRQGLAYSVYGYWSPRFDYPGLFLAGGQTRSETTVPFVRSLLAEIEQIRSTPVPDTELAEAKESILNSFVFQFDSPAESLTRIMRYDYFGYPQDFLFEYQRAVKATTATAVLQAAQTHLRPDQIVTLVVGNNREIQPPLSTLGSEVKTVDIARPQPPSS
ncbi:MAG: insulinase family protein [Chloroflexaceae bacterium]|nr:insulinase family protein [Chloroflexaceae bacterium]